MSQELLNQFTAMNALATQIEQHREWYVYYQGVLEKEQAKRVQNVSVKKHVTDQMVLHKRFMKTKSKELADMALRLSRAIVA